MYENKILLASGCSHTYGNFIYDDNIVSCHNRSWVKKLEKNLKFFSSINLSAPGGSNQRTFRTIMDYFENNIDNASNHVVMIGLTDISRQEYPVLDKIYSLGFPEKTLDDSVEVVRMGNWAMDNKTAHEYYVSFSKLLYDYFYNDDYSLRMINQQIYLMTCFFKRFNIEHYFLNMCADSRIKAYNYNENIFFYDFLCGKHAIHSAIDCGYKIGKDLVPESNCHHLDHDGNEWIAKFIEENILKK
jgi:hypothetical protein